MNISLSGFPAYVAIILFLLMFAMIPMYVISKLRRGTYEFARQYDTIIKTEYEAPYYLTPAELGYLTDAKFSKQEFFATILDLEQRGYLRIDKQSAYSFGITNLNKEGRLKPHERLILEEFSTTSSLSLNNIKNLKKFRNKVLNSLSAKGLVKKQRVDISFLTSRVIIILLIINTSLSLLFALSGESSVIERIVFFFLLPILLSTVTLPLSIVLGYVYHKTVGETGLWTKKMKAVWTEIAGYKYFIEQVELDNIQFESSELKTKTKIKAFPYAVALGLDTEWQERFR